MPQQDAPGHHPWAELATWLGPNPFDAAGQPPANLPPALLPTWRAQQANLAHFATKLPTWVAAGALLPSLAAQQATHHAVAALRPPLPASTLVDLTAGLGADALAAATAGANVLAIEADAERAAVLAHNLHLLAMPNLQARHATAEDTLANLPPASPPGSAWALLDPDRRPGGGPRAHNPAMGLPNPWALWPQLQAKGWGLRLKLSPLVELRALRQLAPAGVAFWAISMNGEVKEVGADLHPHPSPSPPQLLALGQRHGSPFALQQPWPDAGAWPQPPMPPEPLTPKGLEATPHQTWLLLPDAALRLTHLAPHALPMGALLGADGLGLHQGEAPPHYPGQVLPVTAMGQAGLNALARQLKARGIHQAEVTAWRAPIKAPEAQRKLGLKPGGAWRLVVSTLAGQRQPIWFLCQG